MQGQDVTQPGAEAGAASINDSSQPPALGGGEIRLSFKYFFVVLRWGKERRSADRLDEERKNFPVLTATHAPVIAAIWAALFVLLYFAVVISLEGLVFLFS